MGDKIPGPKPWPIVGNSLVFLKSNRKYNSLVPTRDRSYAPRNVFRENIIDIVVKIALLTTGTRALASWNNTRSPRFRFSSNNRRCMQNLWSRRADMVRKAVDAILE